ncbi:DHH family phosphoesterase [Clostridium oryzae]|uniref:Single-stranded-DNA-specific exonuclease RecJ n=1 Tax=Clostridium oryzae TaxID=1450648 RepID=A0A1V4IUX8_9CLOT|nr:DHH family phosphoesterase [Clostridium oryzae]OPJ63584.1 single-stranded-DNA-specific exonuclease RecJ [Clostridium oryzae]
MSRFLENLNYPGFLTTYNPFFLKNMSKVMERTVKAINEREKVVIYGICSSDSICGVSLLLLLFKYLNADVEYYIQDSISRDISSDNIENHIKYLGPKLMITVGCRPQSQNEIELCKNIGLDFIVLDNEKENYDNIIAINPNQKDCLYKFKGLSLSGIAFKLAQALSMYYDMKCIAKYVDLVLLGTLASGMPIRDENEIFIENGLKQAARSKNYGVNALIRANNLEIINIDTMTTLAECIKPTTNAVGRMDNARIAVELFTTTEAYRAKQIAKYLINEVNNYVSL